MDYNNYLNPTLVSVKPSGIRKFFSIAEEMDDVISLGVGEPDFDTPWRIREEGIYTLETGKQVLTRLNRVLQDIRLMPVLFF